jgi:uncharacterized NAD(P)/FAD-binding protein YdhS
VVVIGCGFSGSMVAVHLLRLDSRCRVVLVESCGRFGPGLAYSTPAAVHYLNVPAGNMSALEDDPGHFLRWVQRRDASATGGTFVPRGWYGEYIQSVLADERMRAGGLEGRLREVAGRAVAVETGADGRAVVVVRAAGKDERIETDRVVLAVGNALPARVPVMREFEAAEKVFASPAYVGNPWDAGAIERIRDDEPVLIVGTGLTMMDVVMSLGAADHVGRILAISRHGLLPRPHRSPSRAPAHREPPAGVRGDAWDGRVRSLVRALRRAVRENAGRGTDWRDVVTSIRSITPEIWGRLDASQRSRFLTRLRSFWDAVRHRSAPETSAAVADLIASGRLSVRAGRLLALRLSGERGSVVEAVFRPRGSELDQTVRVARVINCLGPDSDVRRSGDPLLKQLLASGRIVADAHGLGVETTEEGFAVGAEGRASGSLLVAGPMRRARAWENTAVPELRREAVVVARAALGGLANLTRARATVRGAAEAETVSHLDGM